MFGLCTFLQTYRMLHFAEAGERLPPPEQWTAGQRTKALLFGIRIPKPHDDRVPLDFGLACRAATVKSRDGLALAVWLLPAPDPRGTVLLFHGYTSCKANLLPEAVVLHDLGWSVVLADFRGSGDSQGRTTTLGWRESWDVAAVAAWADGEHLPGPRVFYGVSMGAAAILKAVGREGLAADALVLECPYDRLITTVRHRFEMVRVPAFPSAELMAFWGWLQTGCRAFALNPAEYAGNVRVPVLLLHGGRDPRVYVQDARAVADHLKGPVSFHVFPACAHQSYCRAEPEAYRRVVAQWLDGLRAPAVAKPASAP